MSNIMPFQFESKEVRAITHEDGSAWFVAKDVCEALGFSNPSKAVSDHCKRSKRLSYNDSLGLSAQANGLLIIPEPDLYRLVVRANTPEAETFERWVMEEVLPTIRKTGSYSLPGATTTSPIKSTPATPVLPWVQKEFKAALSIAKLCGLRGNDAILSAGQYVANLTGTYPLAVAGITHLTAESQARELTPTEIGKHLGGMSPRSVNVLMVDAGLQFKGEDGHWRPTDKGQPFAVLKDTGKKHLSGTPVQQMKWLESVLPTLEAARTMDLAASEFDAE